MAGQPPTQTPAPPTILPLFGDFYITSPLNYGRPDIHGHSLTPHAGGGAAVFDERRPDVGFLGRCVGRGWARHE